MSKLNRTVYEVKGFHRGFMIDVILKQCWWRRNAEKEQTCNFSFKGKSKTLKGYKRHLGFLSKTSFTVN